MQDQIKVNITSAARDELTTTAFKTIVLIADEHISMISAYRSLKSVIVGNLSAINSIRNIYELSAIKSKYLEMNTTRVAASAASGGSRSKKSKGSPKKLSPWKSVGKAAVKCKGSDGKFQVVQRTTYKNSAYPGELRVRKVKDGKKSYVKFKSAK